jgi:hypothetical protein
MAVPRPLSTQRAQVSLAWVNLKPRVAMQTRRLILPVMAMLLLLYGLLHSPVRRAIAGFFHLASDTCYFACPAAALSLSRMAEVAAGWILIVAALAAAWPIADWFMGESYERAIIYGLSALACLVVPAAALGGLGVWAQLPLLRPPAGPLLVAIPSIVILVAAIRQGWRPSRPHLAAGPLSPLILLMGGLGLALMTGSIGLALAHPPAGGDALSYHAPLAVFLWQDGNLAAFLDRAPIVWALAHPGTAELWFGLLLVAGGEQLAKFGQLPFALLGAAVVAAFARRLRLGPGSARLAGLAFLLVPQVVMQIGIQQNDVAAAVLLAATVALASAPVRTWDYRRLILVGLGLGLSVTTKLVLLPCVVGFGIFVVGAIVWRWGWGNFRGVGVALGVVAATFFLVAAPWWIRNVARYGNPVFPAGIPLLGRGIFVNQLGAIDTEFVPRAALWPIYPLVEAHDDRSGYGALFAVGALPGLAFVSLRRRRLPLFLLALITAWMVPAWWALTLHEPRFFLAMVALGFAFVPWSLICIPRRWRPIGVWLIAATAVFSALVTVDQALLPFARQPTGRAEFYDRVFGIDPFVLALPESEGIIQNTGYATGYAMVGLQEYAAYYPLLGESRSRLVIPADLEATTQSIITKMQARGVHYAYVTAAPDNYAAVEAQYDPKYFELVQFSVIERGESSGARRHLFRLASNADAASGVRRYLFRLKDTAALGVP